MNKKLLVLVSVVLFAAVLGRVWYLHSNDILEVISLRIKGQLLEMAVYNKGNKRVADNKSPYFQQSRLEAENLLTSADGALLLIVKPDSINKIGGRESCLELIYSKPKTFTA